MKYKVGDRVRVKSLDWYNQNKNKLGSVPLGQFSFNYCNTHLCGAILTIKKVLHSYYFVEENSAYWIDEMIEGLVEEEMSLDKAGQITDFEYEGLAYTLPEGYQFVDENGNVINATKIVLEKKKKEYPKTYEECCKVMGIDSTINHTIGTHFRYRDTIEHFIKLLICRDAYWKLYGEENVLGKLWEPTDGPYVYCIYTYKGEIFCDTPSIDCVLSFPTEEMRDAFYENFKSEIEICKELL